MQSLIRSKSAGVTGGRGTAGAGPGRDLLYGSRGVPAAPTYRRPGDLGPYEPLKPVRTPVAILGSLGVCIYVPASRHWLISYSPIHLN